MLGRDARNSGVLPNLSVASLADRPGGREAEMAPRIGSELCERPVYQGPRLRGRRGPTPGITIKQPRVIALIAQAEPRTRARRSAIYQFADAGGLTVEKVPYSIVFVRKSGRKVPQEQNSRGLTVGNRHYKAVLLRKSPPDCRRWKKSGDT